MPQPLLLIISGPPCAGKTTIGRWLAGELRLPRAVGDVIPLADVASGLERVARGDTGGSRIVVDVGG